MSYIGSDPNFSSVFGDAAKDVEFDHVIDAEEDDKLMEAVEALGDRSMGDTQGENDKNVSDIEDELKGTGYEDTVDSGLDIEDDTGLDIELGSYDEKDADDDLSDIEGATTAAAKDGEELIAAREPVGEGDEGDLDIDDDSLDVVGCMGLTDYEDTEEFTDYDDDEDFDPDEDSDFELESCGSKSENDDDEDTPVDEGGDCDSEDDDSSDDEDLELDESWMLMAEADSEMDISDDIDMEDEDLDESTHISEADEEDELEDGDIEAIESEDDGELSDAEVQDLVDAGGDDELIDDLI